MPALIKPNVTVGCDPELFVRNLDTGEIVSVHDLLPGTKAEPFQLRHGCGAIQVDGVAAEINTRPANDYADFENFVDMTLESLVNILKTKGNYELVYEPFHVFDEKYFDSLPLVTRTLGCTPDWNAYTVSYNPPPDRVATPSLCTAAGHVHAGWGEFDPEDPSHITDCALVAKELDYVLGLPSMLWDPSPERRVLYGRAGAFRPKSYGLEYRVLSNKWLDPKLRFYAKKIIESQKTTGGAAAYRPSRFLSTPLSLSQWICQQTQWALARIFAGERFTDQFGDEMAREIIDNNVTDWIHLPKYQKLTRVISLPAIPMPPKPEEKPKKDPDHFKKRNKKAELAIMYGLSNDNVVNPPVFIHDDPPPPPIDPDQMPEPAPHGLDWITLEEANEILNPNGGF